MEKFSGFVEGLSAPELVQLRKFIKDGEARKMVNHFIEILDGSGSVCPVCERAVDEEEDLVLHFGNSGFRQKARFCGHDCLEYFLLQRKVDAQSLNTVSHDEE